MCVPLLLNMSKSTTNSLTVKNLLKQIMLESVKRLTSSYLEHFEENSLQLLQFISSQVLIYCTMECVLNND